MRTVIVCAGLLLPLAAAPVEAKLAINRAVVVEVHAPGTIKGKKHGAVTLVRLMPNVKKGETLTTPLIANTQLTRLGEKERVKIELKDVKPGMIAIIEISGERKLNEPWNLDMLHVLGAAEELDPGLKKILGNVDYSMFVRVTKIGAALTEHKQDVATLEVAIGKMPLILRITKRTEIVWQETDGKRTPAKLEDLKTINLETDIAVSYPWPLMYGDPPMAPATRIMLDPRAKK